VALTAQQPSSSESAPATGPQETLSTITFDKDSARLPDGARDTLAHLASRMTEDATLEVQLLAYAAGDEENASKARRLSLSRALAVRSFLIDQGVRSTRIEVRALGNKVPDGAPDRVDIIGQKRG
jgi:outer membrane protein OmpA-like peptidoglycan-associated protein